jgi:GNAT superfamily N-acetyltransferase
LKQATKAYSLKLGTLADFDDIKRLCIDFYKASIYSEYGHDEDKINSIISEFIYDPSNRIIILGLLESKPIAILAASVQPIIFSKARVATEVLWWVDEEHRQSGVGIQLIQAFEYWSKEVAKADYFQLCSLNGEYADKVGKYYERLGYKLSEKAYLKTCERA